MVNLKLKSEVEAEKLEKKAKQEMKNKNYDLAILLFKDARDIYLQLNFHGKVGFIDKQIVQLKRIMEHISRTKKKHVIQQSNTVKYKLNSEVEIEKEKLIESNNIRTNRETDLMLAEKRRKTLRQQVEEREKKAIFESKRTAKIRMREEQKEQEIQAREVKLKKNANEQKKKKDMTDKANRAMEQAKLSIDKKEFNEAKALYRKSIDIFKTLGWFDQVDILYKEIKNIENYKIDYLRKTRFEAHARQQIKEQFQKRVDGLLMEEKKQEQMKAERLKVLPPGTKRIIEKADLMKVKADNEVNIHKYQRALNRYQYILELYNSIPADKIDLTYYINEIEKKIAELEMKM